jgi:DNA-binding phage protein
MADTPNPSCSGPLCGKVRMLDALKRSGWVISVAARELGVSREAVYKALRRYGLARRAPSKRAMSEVLRAAGAKGGRPRKDAA